MGHERADDDTPRARPCQDCDWYRTQINRAAGDAGPRADLEALYGAHMRRRHSGDEARGLRSV